MLPLNIVSNVPQMSMIDGDTDRMKQFASPASEFRGESSMNSDSNASLFYFTAASKMSSPTSVDTSTISIDYESIEDRVTVTAVFNE